MWRYYQVVWGNPDDAVAWLDNSMHSGRPGPGRSVVAQLLSLHWPSMTLSYEACTLDVGRSDASRSVEATGVF